MTATVQASSLVERYCTRLMKPDPHEPALHVTSLVYDCLRRCFFNVTSEPHFDDVTQIKLNLGKLIHEHYRLDEATHELKLQWDGIVGSLDVYDEATGELLDLKTIWTPGQYIKELPYEHHRRQIEYYCLLLSKNGKRVGPATILYVPIKVAKLVEPRPMSEVESEVAGKVKAIQEAQRNQKPPEGAYNSRECRFCPYLSDCRKIGGWPPDKEKPTKEAP